MGLKDRAGYVCAVACLIVPLWAVSARAQSSASFPPEPGGAPVQAPPPIAPEVPEQPPPPSVPSTAPAPGAAQPALPAPAQAPNDFQYPPAPAPAADTDPRPPLLPYRDGLPVPPGYHVEERSASGLLIAGTTLFAVSYAAALLIASGDDFGNGSGWLAAPVIGPWAAISARDFSCGTSSVESTKKCVNDAFAEVRTIVFITVDGLVQATSVGLLLAGATSGHQELVRDGLKVSLVPPVAGQRDWRLGVGSAF